MTATFLNSKAIRFAASGAVAVALLATAAVDGKTTRPAESAAQAQKALAKGQVDRAIALGEAAVEASPREASLRLILAQAYLKAGRFDSAAATFNDAMELGDNSARTALSLALANVAAGRKGEAVAILDDWRASIPASDLGLAYALAGETGRGVSILADALRGGENTPKLRQNLAYAYALDGRWAEARSMATQDVPANQIDARISEWAQNARPEDHHRRVAALLSVPMREDAGQPVRLALSASPSAVQFAAEDAAVAPAVQVAANEELAPAAAAAYPDAGPQPVQPVAGGFDRTFAQADNTPSYVSQPVIQPAKVARPAVAVRVDPARVAPLAVARRADGSVTGGVSGRAVAAGGTHLVQLGSFSSEQGARRAWGIFASQNPELKTYRMTITPARVHGRNFWRVAAAGLDAGGAGSLCASVKGRGGGCFAYAASSPPAGVVPAHGQAGVQRARRR